MAQSCQRVLVCSSGVTDGRAVRVREHQGNEHVDDVRHGQDEVGVSVLSPMAVTLRSSTIHLHTARTGAFTDDQRIAACTREDAWVKIRPAALSDVDAVVSFAAARRAQYQGYQPTFWRPAADAAARQRPYLAGLVEDPAVITLVAVADHDEVIGFVIATVTQAPPVYDPGGLTCMVDDFTVADPRNWDTIGVDLLRAVSHTAAKRGAAQVVVVTAHLDEAKRAALAASGLSLASEWWVRPLDVE